MASGKPRIKYGMQWHSFVTDLEIELQFIRWGGNHALTDGRVLGKGLFHHFREAQSLCWPEDDHHRWSDLFLKRFLENEILVTMGAGDSSKTDSVAKFSLIDWWTFPNDTLWVFTSTEYRGAELRIWGAIKRLYNRARSNFSSLPGEILEGLHSISTETIDDEHRVARSVNRGLIYVPCKKGQEMEAMSSFVGIKAPRLRHAGDECFPAGTMVDTPSGPRPIETIRAGDEVMSATGVNQVRRVGSRFSKDIVRIKTKDGRAIVCTSDHPFFTNEGWKKACHLSQSQYLISQYEAMQILQETNSEQTLLHAALSCDVDDHYARRAGHAELQEESGQNERIKTRYAQGESTTGGTFTTTAVEQQLHEEHRHQAEGQSFFESNGMGATYSWWKRDWPNGSRKGYCRNVPFARQVEFHSYDEGETWKRTSDSLQIGYSISRNQTSGRSRWNVSQSNHTSKAGCQQDQLVNGAWVDCVEVLQPTDIAGYSEREGGIEVFNLEVETHPSFSVEGLLVHNSQFLKGVLDAYSNWYGKPNFKGSICGNPIDMNDGLCTAAKPVGGWSRFVDNGKTQEWRSSFFNAWVIALDGRDSPNFDYPDDKGPRYDYLIGRKKLDAVRSTHGEDSWQWYNQCIGKPAMGLVLRRVITEDFCRLHGAHDTAIWQGRTRTWIYGLDPAYGGGDRCVGCFIEFGPGLDGKQIMKVYAPELVPISLKSSLPADDQIANFIKQRLGELSIPVENCFYDSLGKGTLGFAFAQIFGSKTPNPVDFGQKPSRRPVRHDLYVEEPDGTKRLKRCDEHYSKFVTELWFSVREIIMGNQMRELPRNVMEEGCDREYYPVAGGKDEIEPKDDMKLRMGYSPDLFDALCVACEGARQRGFRIERIGASVNPQAVDDDDYWEKLAAEYAGDMRKFLPSYVQAKLS